LWVLIGASAPVAVLAIFQQIKVPGVPQFLNTITGGLAEPAIATGTSLHRATGPFVNWAALAGYLLPLLLVLCALALGGQIDRRKRAVLLLASLAMIGLALTAELSAIVCLLIGIVVLGAMYGKARSTFRWLAIGLLGAAILVGPFIGARLSNELSSSAGDARTAGVPQTLDFRWQVWSGQYIPAIEAEPVTGYGVVLPTSIRWVYSESQYVSLLMEGGIPLLLLFGLLSWSMIDKGRALSRSSEPFDQALGRALVVAVAATLVMDLIWPYLSNGGLPQVLWCLYAIAEPRRNRPPLDTSGSLTHASSDLGAQSRDRAPLLVGAQ